MKRCLSLAERGFGMVAPNPMVGCVVVHNERVLAEGFHRIYGGPHAEVDAIEQLSGEALPRNACVYVNLEPCAHHGKTPPCADYLVAKGVRTVVIAVRDPNPKVAGEGIRRLKDAGVDVTVGVCEREARELNRRFFTFHEKARPYVILKWAQTKDGFIARSDYSSRWISSEESRALVHEWRSQEMAVLVGTATAVHDNPHLTARTPENRDGKRNPVRVVIDRMQQVPTSFHVFDEAAPTLLYNEIENYEYPAATLVKIDFAGEVISQILKDLATRGIQSVIVEGGANTLMRFLQAQAWDEARVFEGREAFQSGISAPRIPEELMKHAEIVGTDTMRVYRFA